MPITRLLTESNFTLAQQHVLELAFKNVLRKLDLVDRDDALCALVARKVVDAGKDGYGNAVAITETVERQFRAVMLDQGRKESGDERSPPI